MFLRKPGATAVVVWALASAAAGDGSGTWDDPRLPRVETNEDEQARPVPKLYAELGEGSQPLSLREAIRIGLEHDRGVRLVAQESVDGHAFAITPADPEVEAHRFKAEIMAEVRSIEGAYWSLSHQYVRLWSLGRAADVAEEIVKRARDAKGIQREYNDVTEAGQRLEQFHLDLSTQPFEVVTAERRLRKLLGMAADDGRRIVPTTAPLDAKREHIWDACLATMLEKRPDVVAAKERMKSKKALRADLDAITQVFLPDVAANGSFGPAPDFVSELPDAPGIKNLAETTREATHALRRISLKIDADYKRLQSAKKLRADAIEQLNARRARLDEGGVTICKCLDAVEQYAHLVGQEAQIKSDYNNSIIELEEAKGTLLDYEKLTVVDRP